MPEARSLYCDGAGLTLAYAIIATPVGTQHSISNRLQAKKSLEDRA
jgi:hypothetical protein